MGATMGMSMGQGMGFGLHHNPPQEAPEQVETPVFDPVDASDRKIVTETVALTCATSGASITYRVKYGAGAWSSWSAYSAPFTLSTLGAASLEAKATYVFMTDSEVAAVGYTVTTIGTVATPAMSVPGASYVNDQSVTLSCATSGAAIYYTTDGSTPTTGSTLYTTAIAINADTTLKAKAFKTNYTASEVASETYTLYCADLVISPEEGDYATQQSVTITTTTTGATIYYTTDGSEATTGSTLYTGAITMPLCAVAQFMALAVKANYAPTSISVPVTIRVATAENAFAFKDNGVSDVSCEGAVIIPEAYWSEGVGWIPITSVDANGFEDNIAITSLDLPNSITAIGADAFHGCAAVVSIVLGSGLLTIGANAFDGCEALEAITLPNSVAAIGASAFYGCIALETFTFGTDLDSIGASAFHGCEVLTGVVIPNSVTTLGANAFEGCTGLLTATIGTGVTTCGAYIFSDCTGLLTVNINCVTAAYRVCMGAQAITTVVFGSAATTVAEGAFALCPVTSFTLQANMTIHANSVTMGTNAGLRDQYLLDSKVAGVYLWSEDRTRWELQT
jgi:hypothetical protein